MRMKSFRRREAGRLRRPRFRLGSGGLENGLGPLAGVDVTGEDTADCRAFALAVQEKILVATGKKVEAMVYGDGAFKDPVGKIWELADPVVSPAYTSGLAGAAWCAPWCGCRSTARSWCRAGWPGDRWRTRSPPRPRTPG